MTPNSIVAPVRAGDNPFVTQRTDAIRFNFCNAPFESIECFADHVESKNFRGAIRGQRGRGKTTLLCDLYHHLRKQDHDCELAFISREAELQKTDLATLNQRGASGAILLVDGIERLSLMARNRLLLRSRGFRGLIATTHRIGPLRTLAYCRTSPESLQSILDSLEVRDPQIRARANRLLPRFRGNIRQVLRQLYDEVAEGKLIA